MLLCCYVRRGACERLLRFLDDAEKRLETFRCAVTALLACLKSFSPDGDDRAGLNVENLIQAVKLAAWLASRASFNGAAFFQI